jgi:ribosomal protein S18 acetylase RimI-like enzyme
VNTAVRPMTIADYDAVSALWRASDGVGLRAADERPGIERFLERNAGLSLVAEVDGRLVAAVLCGHDGRNGFLHHLAVAAEFRGRGIGRGLVNRCLRALAAEGITRCSIFVYTRNAPAQGFWRAIGWSLRTDLSMMVKDTAP